jgi:hypothetical protein
MTAPDEQTAADKETAENVRIGEGKPGPGRPKGSANKLTRAAKEAFGLAFDGIGGVEALTAWARDNQTEFYKLYARLIPAEQHVSNPDGTPLNFTLMIPPKNG